jgi:hypothetical protein
MVHNTHNPLRMLLTTPVFKLDPWEVSFDLNSSLFSAVMVDRLLAVKVVYTFDKDSQVNCLARVPQIMPIQTIPIDDRNRIGLVDLKVCLQAVAQGSPEIFADQDKDYNVYLCDYSEPDAPLVGQGMLSQCLASNEEPRMATGRVTKNLLAAFGGGGAKETLEVKLRFSQCVRAQRRDSTMVPTMQTQQSSLTGANTPTETTEWASFLQANPALGRSGSVAAVQSPMLLPTRTDFALNPMEGRPGSRPSSVPPLAPALSQSLPAPNLPRLAPTPGAPNSNSTASAPPEVKRSASRSRVPTGRPRGRPRTRPRKGDTGHTSAAEELPTDEEGPKKKRAKTTKADYPTSMPLDAAPESLRVAASTAGSLRTLRPVGAASGPAASHLVEAPRAPTPVPVPNVAGMPKQQKPRAKAAANLRRESVVTSDAALPTFTEIQFQRSQTQDARSPTESIGQSPLGNYTPADSPADLGSSPPVPRSGAYMRSSPIASSPILPPMPNPNHDSGFMSGGFDDLMEENEKQTEPELPRSGPAKGQRGRKTRIHEGFPFQEVNPGPPELLPTKSIYRPPFPRKDQRAPKLKRSSTAPVSQPPPPPEVDVDAPGEDVSVQFAQLVEVPIATVEEADMGAELELELPAQTASQDSLYMDDFFNISTMASHNQAMDVTLPEILPEPRLPVVLPESKAELAPLPKTAKQSSQKPRQMARAASMSAVPTVPASDPPAPSRLTLPPLAPPTAFSEALCPPSDAPGSNQLSFPSALSPKAAEPESTSKPDGVFGLTLPPLPVPSKSEEPDLPLGESGEVEESGDKNEKEPSTKANKNFIKKQTIKLRLQQAIEDGEMPPYCANCGAIETPTWRKMWCQEREGDPGYHEYSEKPGHVTAIDILEKDTDGKPLRYRLVKKALGQLEDKAKWMELLLCNRELNEPS